MEQPDKRMSRPRVVWGMVWRGLIAGGIGGLVMSLGIALFLTGYMTWTTIQEPHPRTEPFEAFAMFLLSFVLVGGAIGAVVGLALGGIGGLLLALLTLLWFDPLHTVARYQQIIGALGFLLGLGPFLILLAPRSPTSPATPPMGAPLLLFVTVCALIAGVVGVVANRLVVRWYVQWSVRNQGAETPLP